MNKFIVLSLILGLAYSQSCTVANDDRIDCGYMGINQQQCQAKGCCWGPVNQAEELFLPKLQQLQDVPWCFFPAGQNPCGNLSYNANSPGFDSTWYNGMYQNMLSNIDIDSKGGIVAAPDYNTPGGSYVYDWMRDGSLTMRTLQEINDFDLSKYQAKMNDWVQWVIKTMLEPDPNGIDVRVEPKFNLPNGDVYSGGWCRPQTDGPGLRAATLIMYAKTLIQNNQQSYVSQYLWTGNQNNYNGGAIKFHLDWVAANWQSDGCDLWEEIHSTDFFWNRMAFVHSLNLGVQFANQMGDSSSAQRYQTALNAIKPTVQSHYQGSYIYESTNRMKDSAVIHAIVSFNDDQFSLQGPEVAGTIKALNNVFCSAFPINSQDTTSGIPGILYGRYQGDSYAGGNPWQLLTSVLGELYYQGAVSILSSRDHNELITDDEFTNWKDILHLKEKPTVLQFAATSVQAGDSELNRIFQHVKNDNYIIDEQINKSTGAQWSAKSLTWSYANILRALHLRNKSLSQFPINPVQ